MQTFHGMSIASFHKITQVWLCGWPRASPSCPLTKCTWLVQYQARYKDYAASDVDIIPFMSRTLWTACSWAYLRRLDRDYLPYFKCPVCGDMSQAPILTMDGTALSCATIFDKPSMPGRSAGPAHERIPLDSARLPKVGIPLEDRSLIRDVALRNSLLATAKSFSKLTVPEKVRYL
jgi:hypothetical protein